MPDQNKPGEPATSPFEIVTPGKSKKRGSRGIIVAVVIVVFLILSVVAGVLLVRQQQNIQEKAAANLCPAAEACPAAGQPNLLRNCHPAESDNSPAESLCNAAGRVEACGGKQYCCPSASGAWTTDLTVCNSLAAATPTPSPSPTATPAPNTCNGSCGSNSNCQSGLICSGGACRNPLCTTAADCSCGVATPTPTALPTLAPLATPRPIPVTGVDWPTVAGIGVGAAAIIASILIAL